jgi:hypothetical protein
LSALGFVFEKGSFWFKKGFSFLSFLLATVVEVSPVFEKLQFTFKLEILILSFDASECMINYFENTKNTMINCIVN